LPLYLQYVLRNSLTRLVLTTEVDGRSTRPRWTVKLALNRRGVPLESVTSADISGTSWDLA
jgi:hypothetical protein